MNISRQRAYQIRHQQRGLCALCSQPATLYGLCQKHRDEQNLRQRNAYRLKHGIPLDNPLWKRTNTKPS